MSSTLGITPQQEMDVALLWLKLRLTPDPTNVLSPKDAASTVRLEFTNWNALLKLDLFRRDAFENAVAHGAAKAADPVLTFCRNLRTLEQEWLRVRRENALALCEVNGQTAIRYARCGCPAPSGTAGEYVIPS